MADENTQQTQQTTTATDTSTQTTAADTTTATDTTILATDTTAVDTTKVAVPADFPTDWQAKMAGGNKDVEKLLARYGSPVAAAAALAAAQQKIRGAKTVEPLGENPTDEQVAEYRKSTGVPDKAEDYKLPDGVVPDEASKEYLKGFFDKMHKANVPAAMVDHVVRAYFDNVEAAAAQQAESDLTYHTASNLSIRKEWGPGYTANLNAIKGMLSLHPAEVQDNIMGARLADGSKLADNPGALRALLQMAKDINPAATVIPSSADAGKGVEGRLADISKQMSEKGQTWWHNKAQAPLRAEHLQLLEAQSKMAEQARA